MHISSARAEYFRAMSLKPKQRASVQPAVVTANRLIDGHVVWRAGDGRWVEQARDGTVYRGEALAAALEAAAADERRQVVVGAYATDVLDGTAEPVPALLRERIRANGPTVTIGPGPSGNGS